MRAERAATVGPQGIATSRPCRTHRDLRIESSGDSFNDVGLERVRTLEDVQSEGLEPCEASEIFWCVFECGGREHTREELAQHDALWVASIAMRRARAGRREQRASSRRRLFYERGNQIT